MRFLSRLIGKAPAPQRPTRETTPDKRQDQSGQVTAGGGAAAPPDVANLAFGDALINLAYDAHGGATQRAAQRRLAQLIDSNAIRIGQLPRGTQEDAVLIAIAALCEQPGPFEAVAAQIKDAATWVELAVSGGSSRLRQLAAQRVSDPEQLRALVKAAREGDKGVYRIAKSKLDELHASEKRSEAARAHKQAIAETLERHSYKPFDGAYVATLEHLVAEWQALDATLPEVVHSRAIAAIDQAHEVIARHIRAAGAQAARESAIANADPLREDTLVDLRKLLAALFATESVEPSSVADVNERLTALDERWCMTLQYKPASAEQVMQFDALRKAVRRTAERLAASGTLQHRATTLEAAPSDVLCNDIAQFIAPSELLLEAEIPALVMHTRQLLVAHGAREADRRAMLVDTARHVEQLLRKAQHALAAGRSRQAMGIRHTLERKLASLDALPKALAERLQQFDAKMHELQDWKQFAVTPKRGELIEQMQALVGSDETPPQLAERIKRLQEEWKSLAKGSTDTDEDWAKFHAAAQAAYEPCRRYFEAQAQQRERNLERRKELLARLDDYERTTDWGHVEWKNVAHAVRSARQEWRDAGPTDRASTKTLEQAFDTLIERVEQRLAAEYAANLERKQALVKQAQRLEAQTDVAQAVADVKRLQAAWREVGLTPHREGQATWDEFKRSCDAVFERLRQQHAERNAVHSQSEAHALALCEEVESLGQRAGAELFAGAARARELRESFAAIESLPPQKTQSLQRRFTRALDAFERAIGRQKEQSIRRGWETLFANADRLRLRLLQGGDAATLAEELREATTIAKHGPKGADAALQRKLQSNRDLNANEAAGRDLVIRAEIAAELSTPEGDQPRRREMQLQALVQGDARPSGTKREQLEALALELVALGPIASPAYEQLFQRFSRAFFPSS